MNFMWEDVFPDALLCFGKNEFVTFLNNLLASSEQLITGAWISETKFSVKIETKSF